MRSFVAVLMSAMLMTQTAGAEPAPKVPAELSAYMIDGKVPAGDYRWLRGRFAGASPLEIKTFFEAARFNEECAAESRTTMRLKMASIGQVYDPGDDVFGQPTACRQFAQLPIPANVDWGAFSAALERVRPYALGILRGTELAEREVIGRGDFAQQLRGRPLGEQMLRYAWIESQRHEGLTRDYTQLERAIHEGILLRALQDRDEANTEWLAEQVRVKGWPSRAAVGADASESAWLLVQHADADPAFQLTALRLMTPLVAKGQVDPRDFAMLTDRVQLRLSGKQRYGTQWTCVQGKWVPKPLERDVAATDALRKGAKLDSLNENAARINAVYGSCAPG